MCNKEVDVGVIGRTLESKSQTRLWVKWKGDMEKYRRVEEECAVKLLYQGRSRWFYCRNQIGNVWQLLTKLAIWLIPKPIWVTSIPPQRWIHLT